jgi:dTMP kinase
MIDGHFIVLEGIDGAGTSTQAEALKQRFNAMGLAVHVTAEPSGGPVGAMIRQVLSGRLVTRFHEAVRPLGWKIMSLLFAADRLDHLDSEILPNLQEGVNVVCDRYVYSSLVYQSTSAEGDDPTAWITEINRYVKKPDLVLYLKVDPQTAKERCLARDSRLEIFDDPVFQKRLAGNYERLAEEASDVNIITIDGDESIDQVTDACWSQVEKLRAAGAPS